MKIALFAFTRQGIRTAQDCAQALAGEQDIVRMFVPRRLEKSGMECLEPPLTEFCGPVFQWADAMIFTGAAGIAVRAIAPHVRDKQTDPAVLSVDELARFVIPLLSGHIGGANEMAVRLADALKAAAAVSTATDINGRFSVDAWAVKQGLLIDDIKAAKAVSAAVLEGNVPLVSDFPIIGPLPPGVVMGDSGDVGICISWRRKNPFRHTLLLVPPVLRLGIGCRKGTEAETIAAVADHVMEESAIHPAAVAAVATIDLKKDEAGLLRFCRERGWPLECYSAEELQAAPGTFTPSDFVRNITGVDNVCERAAAVHGEQLVIHKTAGHGVTVAAAAAHWEVRFE